MFRSLAHGIPSHPPSPAAHRAILQPRCPGTPGLFAAFPLTPPMHDPGFYPLLADGQGFCHLIHCDVEDGRIKVGVAIFEPGPAEPWLQLTSERNYEGDRCEIRLPDEAVNSSARLKVYNIDLPYRQLS
jgi:hypothetical protein